MKTMMKKIMFVCVLGVASQTQAAMYTTTGDTFTYGNMNWTTSFEYKANSTDGLGNEITVAPPTLEAPGGEIWTGNNDGTFGLDEAFNDQIEIVGSNNNAAPLNGPDGLPFTEDDIFFPSESKMWALADVDGSVSFDWFFSTGDLDGEFDFFMTVVKANEQIVYIDRLSNISGPEQSGNQAGFGCGLLLTCEGAFGSVINLTAGDIFSLSIDTADNLGGEARVDISNFNFTSNDDRFPAVPVPAAVWLFGSAMAGLGFMRKRKDLKVAV